MKPDTAEGTTVVGGRVAREVAEIEGTGSTVPVAGPFDVIAIVEAASIDALGKMVVSRIQGVKAGFEVLPGRPYPSPEE